MPRVTLYRIMTFEDFKDRGMLTQGNDTHIIIPPGWNLEGRMAYLYGEYILEREYVHLNDVRYNHNGLNLGRYNPQHVRNSSFCSSYTVYPGPEPSDDKLIEMFRTDDAWSLSKAERAVTFLDIPPWSGRIVK